MLTDEQTAALDALAGRLRGEPKAGDLEAACQALVASAALVRACKRLSDWCRGLGYTPDELYEMERAVGDLMETVL